MVFWRKRSFVMGSLALGIIKFRKKRKFRKRFDLDRISDEEAKLWFRFEKRDLVSLQKALGIPNTVFIPGHDVVPGVEALCILLRRLVYPNRLFEACQLLGRSIFSVSRIFNHVLMLVHDKHKHLLEGITAPWMDDDIFEDFASATADHDAPIDTCVGFVDGTMRFTCRPKRYQKAAYSGHKRAHGLKYQAIMFPNGIIGHLYGPLEGCRHDAGMLRESGLLRILPAAFGRPAGHPYCIYGDPAYPISPYLLSPYRAARLTNGQAEWNKKMSSVRQAVEWGFGNVAAKWAFVDFKKNQKIFLQPVGVYYAVAVILTNCLNCLYPNQTSQYFNCDPPSLNEYLGFVEEE